MMKFIYAYVFTLAGEAISWNCLKRTLIASSIMLTEFITCYKTKFKMFGQRTLY